MAASERPMPDVAGVRHSRHQAGELTLHVAEAGEGAPLVLLHGWPQHWYEWRDVIGPLARERRVLCPDLRGFGWSDAPPRGYAKETLARDVLALLDGLQIDRFALVGHDWGGWTGYLICLLAPERVERFVALNIPHPFQRPSPRAAATIWRLWYQWVIATPGLGERAVAALASAPNAVSRWAGNPWDDAETRHFLGQLAEPARVNATVQLYREFVVREAPAMARGRWLGHRLTTPTLVLHGVGDRIVRPVHLEGLERHADDARVELVPDTGHFIVDERPELVLERTQAFLAAG